MIGEDEPKSPLAHLSGGRPGGLSTGWCAARLAATLAERLSVGATTWEVALPQDAVQHC